jgi:hypothetical protein
MLLKRLLSLSALFICSTVHAGGPLVLEGPAGHTPATYQDPNIVFNIESGDLGVIATNAQANQMVVDALSLWNGIPDATISLTRGSNIPVDINISNFTSYIPDPNNNAVHNDSDGLNPVVYDADGSIIDAFFGVGQSSSVVGFAASSILVGGSYFTEGFAVINGKNLGLSPARITLIIAHEIGHMFGLDHSQTNVDYMQSLSTGCVSATDSYPLMYPYACRTKAVLHVDDELAVATLYPAAGFSLSKGQLAGYFRTPSGTAILGANLWVENTSTGDIYSIVSDYLAQGTGYFSLMLPTGTYTLHASPINSEFFGGSSVGPYAQDMTGASFQSPAKDIGIVDFVADGMNIALVDVTATKATNVTFISDGSGTFTTGNSVTDPVPAPVVSSGSSGGSLSPLVFLTMGLLLAIGRVTRQAAHGNLGC